MKTMIFAAILLAAPVAAFAQPASNDSNVQPSVMPKIEASASSQAAIVRPRAVRIAKNPRSLTVALSHDANVAMASSNIGG